MTTEPRPAPTTAPLLSVGLRGDPDHAREVMEAVGDRLHEVFIAPPPEICGTGRSKQFHATLESIAEVRAITAEYGVRLDVLLNGSCFGGEEATRDFSATMLEFVAFLEDIGVDMTTVANSMLLGLILRNRRSIEVSTSTFMNVADPIKARVFAEMGVDRIKVVQTVNRDFPMLERIRANVDVDLELYCNSRCLFGAQCPSFFSHRHYTAHNASRNDEGAIDPYLAWCRSERAANPLHVLMAPAIRPEDIASYEALGYSHFKLALRTLPADRVIDIVRAYASRRWDGPVGVLLSGRPETSAHHSPDNRELDGLLDEVAYLPAERQILRYKLRYNRIVPPHRRVELNSSLPLRFGPGPRVLG